MMSSAPSPPTEEYEPVTGLDAKSMELARSIEAKAAAKTASDYVHVVWAYALIWALFAGYGILLWRKTGKLAADLAQLRSKLDRS